MNQTDLHPFLSDPAALPRSTTLLRESGLRILLLHVKDTEGIPEHHTAGAISVQCLQGEVNFLLGRRKSTNPRSADERAARISSQFGCTAGKRAAGHDL